MQRLLITLVLLTLNSGALGADAPGGAAAKPNVILIVGDDLGYADVGAQGLSKDVKTPALDAIAAGGVRFTSGYVSCPVCSPTRAALMTGRYQTRFGHEFNPGNTPRENFGLPLEETTIADVLKKAGYHTGIVGKWHLGQNEAFLPQKRGFDEFFGFLSGAHSYTQHRGSILRGTEVVEETEYLTDAFAREAVDFVNRNHETPFFLYLPFNAVHTPLDVPPAKYVEPFEQIQDSKRRVMCAMLYAMDSAIGQVMEALQKHQIDGEKTLVIFHTDNGGPTKANTSRNDPLSGFKGGVREGGVRVPSLMRWDKHIPAGKVEDAPVMQIDYFATIASAAGADEAIKDLKLDGVNLLPYLTGKTSEKPHQTLYWRYGQRWAVRDGNMKLFDGGEGETLVDLSADPAEANNLLSSQPDEARRLKTLYDAWNSQNVEPRWNTQRTRQRPRRGQQPPAATADE